MTMPQPPARQLIDMGNPLLAQAPVQLDTGDLDAPGGKVGVLTFRSPSATFTAFLGAGDVRRWAQLLSGLADRLEGTLVTASPGALSHLDRMRGQRQPGT